MGMPFLACLQTQKVTEKPVNFSGVSLEQVEALSRKWLEDRGEHGDWFEITEFVRVKRAVIEGEKPEPVAPEPAWRGHAFVPQAAASRCRKCNAAYEEHLKG